MLDNLWFDIFICFHILIDFINVFMANITIAFARGTLPLLATTYPCMVY